MLYMLILGIEFPNSASWNMSYAGGKKKKEIEYKQISMK